VALQQNRLQLPPRAGAKTQKCASDRSKIKFLQLMFEALFRIAKF
jgi:hypothetical protein